MLEIKNISKTYPNSQRQILNNISFEIAEGESVAIVGPSGTGKSTLLNVMSTIDLPTSGTVLFNGSELNSFTSDEKAVFRNKEMGFVFQQHHLLPQLSLIENVLIPTLPEKDKEKKHEAKQRALELIEWVGLSDLINQKPGQMSVGECQRTAVVRALINKPKILFADEPTGSLDVDSSEQLLDLLVALNKEQNLTIVMVTHALEMAAKLNKQLKLQRGLLENI